MGKMGKNREYQGKKHNCMHKKGPKSVELVFAEHDFLGTEPLRIAKETFTTFILSVSSQFLCSLNWKSPCFQYLRLIQYLRYILVTCLLLADTEIDE